MTDYQGKPKKKTDEKEKVAKKIAPVVSNDVVVKKKPFFRKVKDTFIEADFKSVVHYIFADVLLPAAKNAIVDASAKGIERMIYGESASRRRQYGPGPRFTYQSPVNRGYGSVMSRMAPGVERGPRSRPSRDDYILSSREEADLVLEHMDNVLEQYEVVTVGDLNELIGISSSHVDNKWGWTFLGGANVRQTRDGFLLDLPPVEPI
jgi:hypothetical protein